VKTPFPEYVVGQLFERISRFAEFAVEMTFPEDSGDEHRNAPEY
jgi:hypothetical protein